MAIDAYVGLPGSGKSYGVLVNVILPALERGQRVVTNIPLNLDKIAALSFDTKLITQLERVPGTAAWIDGTAGACIVIDEAYHWWPSGLKADAMPIAQRTFFAEHRHRSAGGFSTQIAIVVQDLGMLASFVRQLVDKTFRAVKLDAVGADTRFRVDVYQGAVTGPNPPAKLRLSSEHGKYEAKFYECYTSQTQAQGGSFGTQKRADKRSTVWSSWTMRFAILALVLLPFMVAGVACSLKNFKDSVTAKPKHLQDAKPAPAPAPPPPPSAPPVTVAALPVAAPQVTAPAPAQPAEPPKPKEPELSKLWRIIGVAVRTDGTGQALLATTGARRWITLDVCQRKGIDVDMICTVDGEIVSYYSGQGGVFASAQRAPGL